MTWFKKPTTSATEKNSPEVSAGGSGNLELESLAAEAMAAEGFSAAPEPAAPAQGTQAAKTSPEIIARLSKLMFGTIASRAGAHWQLTDKEAAEIGAAAAPVVDKYIPSMLDKYGAEIALAWSVANIIIPRMMTGRGDGQKGADNVHTGQEG